MNRALAALAAACLLAPAPARAAAIDLHAHLFMDATLPGIFRGHLGDGPPLSTTRSDRFKNQVSLKDLETANVRLVATALNTPYVISHLRGGYHRSLLKQIEAVEKWAAKHPRATIVRTPEDAAAVLKSKEWRLGIIIAVEGTGGADTKEFIDHLWDRGMRLLTITHLVDTRWGGSAAVRYWPKPTCVPGGKDPGARNPKGLSKDGEALLDYAVAKGLLVDLSHASDKTLRDIIARHPRLPLIFSHQAARELTPCERTISTEILREVKRSRGMIGLIFATDYVGDNVAGFISHAKAMAREAGPEALALGTDYNGMIKRIEGAGDSRGYALALKELRSAGIPADRSAEAFVEVWKRSLINRR